MKRREQKTGINWTTWGSSEQGKAGCVSSALKMRWQTNIFSSTVANLKQKATKFLTKVKEKFKANQNTMPHRRENLQRQLNISAHDTTTGKNVWETNCSKTFACLSVVCLLFSNFCLSCYPNIQRADSLFHGFRDFEHTSLVNLSSQGNLHTADWYPGQ